MVRVILNVIWLVFCGLWMAICYALAGLVCFILIITIPFGIAASGSPPTYYGRSAARSTGAPAPASAR